MLITYRIGDEKIFWQFWNKNVIVISDDTGWSITIFRKGCPEKIKNIYRRLTNGTEKLIEEI